MKDLIEFGKRIRLLRQRQHLSLRELGERSGVSYSFINSIENNRFSPSRETVIALSGALNGADKNELLLLAGYAPTEGGALEAPASAAAAEIDDPEVSLFFKDFQSAPKERRDEMLRFWNFIKSQQPDRKQDDPQEPES